MRLVKILIRLREGTGCSEFSLGAHVQSKFSDIEALTTNEHDTQSLRFMNYSRENPKRDKINEHTHEGSTWNVLDATKQIRDDYPNSISFSSASCKSIDINYICKLHNILLCHW